jgi:hypothetical protein
MRTIRWTDEPARAVTNGLEKPRYYSPRVGQARVRGDAPEDGLGPIEGLDEGRGVINRTLDHLGLGRKFRVNPGAVAGNGPDRLSSRDELYKDVATNLAGWRGDDEHGASC